MPTDYITEAESDAWDTVTEFTEEILDQIRRGDEISDDLHNDYPNGDSYHNETHEDRRYTLLQAAEVLDRLSEWEEDDYGLWQGLPPVEAIQCQAAYTYGRCVYAKWCDLVADLNSEATDIDFGDSAEEGSEEAVWNARAKWVAVYIACEKGEQYNGTLAEVFSGAKEACGRGEFTGLLVLADAVAEAGDERTAKEIREIATS